MALPIIGGKGGSGASFVTKPDTLRSNDSFEILLGLGSGRWKGLTNGLPSLKINGVSMQNADGTSNFENVFAIFADGNPLQNQMVTFNLGGGGATQAIGTALANANASGPGSWVSGAVSTPGVNFLDLRFVVQQLYYQDKKGIRENTATIEIEMRPSGSATWINIFAAPTGSSTVYTPSGYSYTDDRTSASMKLYLGRSLFNINGTGFKGSTGGTGLAIAGKTNSAFVKEMRVAVPNTGAYANKTWEVRARLVEKDTVDAEPIQERRNIAFESITAVNNTPLGDHPDWDGLVWLQVHGKASNQFNGFPEIEGVFDTKICKVPPSAVFNPATRAYTVTTWDGSYVEAFTTDPAWQIKEFVEDPIQGLAGLQPGSTLDKWDALEASKYYSELVPDGLGGTHPRFNLNLTINEARDVEEMMGFLAGAVNSYTEEVGGGVWRLKVDKPESPKMLFTLDNTFGEFEYSHTDVDTRFNDWRGTFINEELGYETDTVRVFDQADIDQNGIRFTEVALVGCTNKQEALRRLMFRLRVSLNEYKIASFTTNRLGRYLSPLDTILIADGSLNADHLVKSSSRFHSSTETSVILKRPLRLEVGVTYMIQFTTTDKTTITRTVTNTAGQRGDVTTIYINTALPSNVMADSAVALQATGLPANPVAYRIINIERSEQDEDQYSITASIIDSGKWSAMDNVSATDLLAQESVITIGPPTVPLAGMFFPTLVSTDFETKRILQINWDRPGGNYLDGFKLEYSLNDAAYITLNEKLSDSYFEMQNPEDGTYDFRITSLDRRGVVSTPLVQRYVLDGSRALTAPTHVRGTLAARPTTAPYEGFRYTAPTTSGSSVPTTYVWEGGMWKSETNLVTTGTDIGVENGATVGATAAQAQNISQLLVDVSGLQTTYGNTASSAANASAAATSASAANTSAIASANSAISALRAAVILFPADFSQNGKYFTETIGGDPTTVADPTNYTYQTVAGYGITARANAAVAQRIFGPKGVVPVVAGRKSRATVVARTYADATNGAVNQYFAVYANALDATYGQLGQIAVYGDVYPVSDPNLRASEGWQTFDGLVDHNTTLSSFPTAAFIRFTTISNFSAAQGGSEPNSQPEYARFVVEDVTAQKAASASAVSASTSATQSANSATASSNSALSASAFSANSNSRGPGARGLTANGSFDAGDVDWSKTSMTWVNDGTKGSLYRGTSGAAQCQLRSTRLVEVDTTRKYKITVKFFVVGAAQYQYLGIVSYNTAGAELGIHYAELVYTQVAASASEYTYSAIFTGTSAGAYVGSPDFNIGAKSIAPLLYSNYSGVAGAYTEITELYIEDVTGVEAAATSASAALVSQQSATASANSATGSASTASTQAGISTTQAGNAATSASNAQTFATNSSTSAASAATNATLAASYSSSAVAAAAATNPSTFQEGLTFFSNAPNFTPGSLMGAHPYAANFSTVSVANEGQVLELYDNAGFGGQNLTSKRPTEIVSGRTYSTRVRQRITSGNSQTRYIGFVVYNSSGNYIGQFYAPSVALTNGGAWDDYTYTLTSAGMVQSYPTAAYIVPLALLNYPNGAAGNRHQVSLLELKDTTESAAAATSASAANTSAVSASASASSASNSSTLAASSQSAAAGSASAALGSQNAASSSASAALTSQNSASTSATNAGTSAGTATTQAGNASVSAGNAATSASNAATSSTSASTSAAAALSSATLAASVGSGGLNANGGFDDFPSANTGELPTSWTSDATGTGNGYRVSDGIGGYAYRLPSVAGSQCYVATVPPVTGLQPNGYAVVEADIFLNSGALTGAGVLFRTSTDQNLVFSTDKDATGVAPGAGVAGQGYTFRKLFKLPATVTSCNLYIMSHWSSLGSIAAANDITWNRCIVRPATQTEIRDQTVLAPMEASVTTAAGAIAELAGRSTAFWQVQTNTGAGAATSFISAVSRTSRPADAALTFNSYVSNASILNRDITTTGASNNDWNHGAVSDQALTSGAYAQANFGGSGEHVMFGLTDTTTATDFSYIDYAIYFPASTSIRTYESGIGGGTYFGNFYDTYGVHYNNADVIYYRNGAEFARTVGVGAGRTFRFMASIYSVGGKVKNAVFGASPAVNASEVSIGASEFHIYNPTGGTGNLWKKAMSVSGGNAIFYGGLTATTFIRLGNGNGWPVALKSQTYTVTDGTVVSFGTDLGAVPALDFSSVGLAPLNSGETYSLYADSATGSGFTARLKIATPGASTSYTVNTGQGASSFGGLQMQKSGTDATSNNYTFNASVVVTGLQTSREYSPDAWYYDRSVTFRYWRYKSGVWTEIGQDYASASQSFASGGSRAITVYSSGTFNLGTAPEYFGVSYSDVAGGTASGLVFTSVTWTAQAQSGVRTATPNGETTKVVVRP